MWWLFERIRNPNPKSFFQKLLKCNFCYVEITIQMLLVSLNMTGPERIFSSPLNIIFSIPNIRRWEWKRMLATKRIEGWIHVKEINGDLLKPSREYFQQF